MIKFPYSKPEILQEDIDAVLSVLKNGYLTQGKQLEEFQNKISEEFNCNYSILCNSGTAALHLLYDAIGLGPDAGLVTSPITFLSTANAARMCNAPVIFADVDPVTGLITPDTLKKALEISNLKIKAVTIVHLGGKVCDLEGLYSVANDYDCLLIEDASHAPGAFHEDKDSVLTKIGSCKYSKATIFSFHAIKHIAMGEGGCVTSNDPILAKKILEKRNHGILRDKDKFMYNPEPIAPWYYEMKEIGWNYRVDEASCALGLSQFKRLEENIDKRRNIVDLYNKAFVNNDFIDTPQVKNNSLSYVWHLYSISIDFYACKSSRGEVMNKLFKKGIQTQVHYIPLFLQPYYRLPDIEQFIGSLEYYKNTLSIPLYTQLNDEDINFISSTINKVVSL